MHKSARENGQFVMLEKNKNHYKYDKKLVSFGDSLEPNVEDTNKEAE